MKLSKSQRSQALAWRSVMGFTLDEIAHNFGLTPDEIATKLVTARAEREAAGKSTEPVPVIPPAGEHKSTHTEILIDCIKALESIVWACDNLVGHHAAKLSKDTARAALKNAGFIS